MKILNYKLIIQQTKEESIFTAITHKTPPDSFTSHNLLHFLKKKLYTKDEITNFIKKLKAQLEELFGECKIRGGFEGSNDAFMLTGRVIPDYQYKGKPWRLWDCNRFYIGDDKSDNIINGKLVDYGAIHYNFDNQSQLDYAKEQIDACKLLGVDFSRVENFENNNEELINALKRVGLKPDKRSFREKFTDFIKSKLQK